MSVSIVAKGEVITAFLNGEIDHHTAAELRTTIDDAVVNNKPTLLVLDFKNVSFMDSSGIGLVMGRYKNLQKSGAKLHLVNLSENLYKIMKLAGIERLAVIEKGA